MPDVAVITGLTMQIKNHGGTGANSFTILGNLQVDIASPFFSGTANLLAFEYEAAADASHVGIFNPLPLARHWHSASLDPSGIQH